MAKTIYNEDTLALTLAEYLRTATTEKLLDIYSEMTPWYKGETLGYAGIARVILVQCGRDDSALSLMGFYQDTAIELLSRMI